MKIFYKLNVHRQKCPFRIKYFHSCNFFQPNQNFLRYNSPESAAIVLQIEKRGRCAGHDKTQLFNLVMQCSCLRFNFSLETKATDCVDKLVKKVAWQTTVSFIFHSVKCQRSVNLNPVSGALSKYLREAIYMMNYELGAGVEVFNLSLLSSSHPLCRFVSTVKRHSSLDCDVIVRI